jgi:putative transposase
MSDKSNVQVRWNYKLNPNSSQDGLMGEWLETLRRHRNYCLRERELGWNSNNQYSDEPVSYGYGAFCDLETRAEYGSCCPLSCPVLKHGVLSAELVKVSKSIVVWGNPSDVQMKRTTQLRRENEYYRRIDSDVLQRNIAKLDQSFAGFWQHGRGFPRYATRVTFKSFEYKPRRCKFEVNPVAGKKHRYSRVYLPGIGWVRFFDSRPIPENVETRTVTITRRSDGWYLSVLLNLPESLPTETPIEKVDSMVGIDVGINRLVALSDGSFVENPRFGTDKRIRRRLRIRQRRVHRKVKGSKNRAKAGKAVARVHQKVANQREAYQWNAAQKVVRTAQSVAHEALNIKGMKKRCKPKRVGGRFMPNGQSAKRGLNRSISDAAWGGLFSKIAWLSIKSGKPVIQYNPQYTSQECSACGHVSKDNREGEKFICEECGHIDHADTQASRTGLKRVGLKFVSTRRKNLPGDSRKVTPVSHDSAIRGKRNQGRNPKSKTHLLSEVEALSETGIIEQLSIFGLVTLETG